MLGLILVVVLVLSLVAVAPHWEYRADGVIYGTGIGLFLLLVVVAMLWAFGVI